MKYHIMKNVLKLSHVLRKKKKICFSNYGHISVLYLALDNTYLWVDILLTFAISLTYSVRSKVLYPIIQLLMFLMNTEHT